MDREAEEDRLSFHFPIRSINLNPPTLDGSEFMNDSIQITPKKVTFSVDHDSSIVGRKISFRQGYEREAASPQPTRTTGEQ